MPRYTTSQTYTEGNTQIVALPESGSNNSQIVEFKGEVAPTDRKDDEDLEEKLRRISDQVPVRISNTSGSSAGSGSGDFHQVCTTLDHLSHTFFFFFACLLALKSEVKMGKFCFENVCYFRLSAVDPFLVPYEIQMLHLASCLVFLHMLSRKSGFLTHS